MRGLLTARLGRVGCVTREAGSGADALDDLAVPGVPTDLLLLDFHMPGISGLDVVRRLRRGGMTVPAILMTGCAETAIQAEALSLGVHILEKPFSFDELRRTAALLIVSRRAESRRSPFVARGDVMTDVMTVLQRRLSQRP